MRSLNERLKNTFPKRNISLYNNQLHPNKKNIVFIEIKFLQTRYQLKKKLLFSEVKDTQFRKSSPLHRKTDSETSRTYNPKDNQRPLQAGVHRLPLEYLAKDGPHKADQRNSYQQDTCNVHHNGRQWRSRQYHISHREKGNESCTTPNSHPTPPNQQKTAPRIPLQTQTVSDCK